MKEPFKTIEPDQISDNVFKLIGTDWMLITAGTPQGYNTMTAGWGGFGVLWGRRVCFCFIRPQRYTYGFMERAAHFTLSFFEERYRDVLEFCGSRSGRDVDKFAETGLTTIPSTTGAIYFAEARLVMECKKIYFQDINPDHFIDLGIGEHYPGKDYHRMYVGEVMRCLTR